MEPNFHTSPNLRKHRPWGHNSTKNHDRRLSLDGCRVNHKFECHVSISSQISYNHWQSLVPESRFFRSLFRHWQFTSNQWWEYLEWMGQKKEVTWHKHVLRYINAPCTIWLWFLFCWCVKNKICLNHSKPWRQIDWMYDMKIYKNSKSICAICFYTMTNIKTNRLISYCKPRENQQTVSKKTRSFSITLKLGPYFLTNLQKTYSALPSSALHDGGSQAPGCQVGKLTYVRIIPETTKKWCFKLFANMVYI